MDFICHYQFPHLLISMGVLFGLEVCWQADYAKIPRHTIRKVQINKMLLQ